MSGHRTISELLASRWKPLNFAKVYIHTIHTICRNALPIMLCMLDIIEDMKLNGSCWPLCAIMSECPGCLGTSSSSLCLWCRWWCPSWPSVNAIIGLPGNILPPNIASMPCIRSRCPLQVITKTHHLHHKLQVTIYQLATANTDDFHLNVQAQLHAMVLLNICDSVISYCLTIPKSQNCVQVSSTVQCSTIHNCEMTTGVLPEKWILVELPEKRTAKHCAIFLLLPPNN